MAGKLLTTNPKSAALEQDSFPNRIEVYVNTDTVLQNSPTARSFEDKSMIKKYVTLLFKRGDFQYVHIVKPLRNIVKKPIAILTKEQTAKLTTYLDEGKSTTT